MSTSVKIKKSTIIATLILDSVFLLSFLITYNFAHPGRWQSVTSFVTNPQAVADSAKSTFNSAKSGMPKAYIVQSGSMEPSIGVGGIVFSKPGGGYKVNDVVTFMPGGEYVEQVFTKEVKTKNLVTHRIVGISESDGKTYYQTKGDANEDPDTEKIVEGQIVGRVMLTIPKLGYVAHYAKRPYGFILLVIVPATIIVYEESKNLFSETGKATKGLITSFKKRKKKDDNDTFQDYTAGYEDKPTSLFDGFHKHVNHSVNKATVLIPLFGAFFVFTGLAAAYFNDTELSSQNVLQAGIWTTPTPIPPQVADHIVISEVQITGGPGNAGHDFVEFHNPTNSPIDLQGHRLVSRTGNSAIDNTMKSWTSTAVVPANGYYLWASSSDGDSPFIVIADTTTTSSIGASNSIALRNGVENTGTIIDALSWNDGSTLGEGIVFDPDPGTNQSMERKAYPVSTAATMEGGADALKGNGFDAGDNNTDFILRTVSQPQNSASATETP